MKVCFICRGYPGLGKVVGCVAIDAILKNAYPENYESLFLTYYNGYDFLNALGCHAINMIDRDSQIQQNGFCTPFGLETRKCVDAITQFQPDLVFNDGEPYLIEITSEVLKLTTIVLAHPADLYSSTNSDLAINLFRYFYSKASLVIAHGLDKLPSDRVWLGGKAGQVIEINTLIRDSIYQHTLEEECAKVSQPHIVGILGGGSKNVSSLFRAGTQQFGEWIMSACNEIGVQAITLYCADETIHKNLRNISENFKIAPILISEPRDNIKDMIQASVVIGRAGRNLISELIALNKKAIIVPVQAEAFRGGNQVKTAERAVQLSPNLQISLLTEGYENFRQKLVMQLDASLHKTSWKPGNGEILQVLRPLITNLLYKVDTHSCTAIPKQY